MAATSKMSPDDEVSRDKRQWHKAARVKGLDFDVGQIATPSERPKTVTREYWVRHGGDVAGPYPASQLKELAEKGRLPSEAEISSDRQYWRRADQIKGLQFCTVSGDDEVQPQRGTAPSDSLDEQSQKKRYLWRAFAVLCCFIGEAVCLTLCANSRLTEICYYGFLVFTAFFLFWAIVTLWNRSVSRTMFVCAICSLAFVIPPTVLLYRSFNRFMSFKSHQDLTRQETLQSLGQPTKMVDPAQGFAGGPGRVQLTYMIRVYPFKCGWYFIFEGEELVLSMQIFPPGIGFF